MTSPCLLSTSGETKSLWKSWDNSSTTEDSTCWTRPKEECLRISRICSTSELCNIPAEVVTTSRTDWKDNSTFSTWSCRCQLSQSTDPSSSTSSNPNTTPQKWIRLSKDSLEQPSNFGIKWKTPCCPHQRSSITCSTWENFRECSRESCKLRRKWSMRLLRTQGLDQTCF